MGFYLYLVWLLSTAAWVWLALAPLPQASPEWLAQTRELCFGTLANGLPDTHGWVSLAAPLPMLVSLVILMGSDLRRQLRGPVGVVLLVCPLVILSYVAYRVAAAPRLAPPPVTGPLPVDYPTVDLACPPFRLQDQTGQNFGPEQLKGRISLVTFAYAHCQTVCPGLIENVRQAAFGSGCQLVVVTLDPRRDTCGSLGGLAHYWKLPDDARLLGGEVAEVEQALRAFEVPLVREESSGEITHPALVYLFDREARLRYRFSSPSANWLVEACKRLL